MSSSSTAAIDEKKKKATISANPAINVVSSLLVSLASLGVVIVVGSLYLYMGKVAQSNLLPTCSSYEPYTQLKPSFGEKVIDINIVRTSKGNFSTKLEAPLSENIEVINKSFGFLRDMIYNTDSTPFKLYIATTIQQLLAFNFSVNNAVYNFMNSNLSETVVVFFSLFVSIFVQCIVGFFNTIYLSFLMFYNLSLLFSSKKVMNGQATWTDGDMWGILTWYWSIFYIILLLIFFFSVGITLFIPVVTFIVTLYCMFYPLSIHLKNKSTGKRYTVMDTIKNVFKFKISIIMFVISFLIVSTISSNYGSNAALISIAGCVLAFFFLSVYQATGPTKLTTPGVGLFTQADKVCKSIDKSTSQATLFGKLSNLF